jgi:hypothetical protein
MYLKELGVTYILATYSREKITTDTSSKTFSISTVFSDMLGTVSMVNETRDEKINT